MFWVEVALLGVPMLLVAFRRIRGNPQALFASAAMVVGGFLVNRLNVSLTGLERPREAATCRRGWKWLLRCRSSSWE